MNFDFEIELRKAVARAQDEERERIFQTLSQVICQEDNFKDFVKNINWISEPLLFNDRVKRMRGILEGYLEAFDKSPMEDSPLKKNPSDLFIYICPECDAQTTVHGFSVKCEGCGFPFSRNDSPPQGFKEIPKGKVGISEGPSIPVQPDDSKKTRSCYRCGGDTPLCNGSTYEYYCKHCGIIFYREEGGKG